MHKKMMASVASLSAVMIVLSGCGTAQSNAGTASSAVTLHALFMKQAGYSQQNIEDMTTAFEKSHPNIHVDVSFVPYDSLHDKIVTGLATGGNSYDTVLIDTIWTPEFAKAGFLENLTSKIPATVKADAFNPALQTVEYQGQFYGLPWIMDTKYLYYNTKMLKEAGITAPPTTWEQVATDAQMIKAKGITKYPLDWSWSQAEALVCDYSVLTADFGGQIVDQNGKLAVNQGGAMKALNYMVSTMKQGLSSPGSTQSLEDDVRKVMSQGQAAFSLNWTYAYALENDKTQSQVPGQIGVEPVPGSMDVAAPGSSVNGSMGMAIAKNTKYADQTLQYIEYLTSQQVENQYAQLSLPFYQSSFKDPAVVKTEPDMVKTAAVQFNHMINRPAVPQYEALSHILQVQIQKALLGQESPQQAMDQAVSQWNSQQSNNN